METVAKRLSMTDHPVNGPKARAQVFPFWTSGARAGRVPAPVPIPTPGARPPPMDETLLSRREALRTTALAGLLLPVAGALPRALALEAPAARRPSTLNLGLATYSLRKYPTEQAVEILKRLQVRSVSVFRVHVPILLSTPDVCRDMAAKFRDAGLPIASTGVVALANDEGVMRKAFECGRAAGLKTMTASYKEPPDAATLRLTERFVAEYDMRIAFHNHGPEDKIFPSPFDVWAAVQPYDKRMGLCLDVGHATRAGADPVEAIVKCHRRLYDVHIKDTLSRVGDHKDQSVGLGFGRIDLRAVFAALLDVGYGGQVGLEDEVESDDPIPNIAQSLGYMRGLLAGLTPAA